MNDLYTKALEELANAQKRQIDSYFTHSGEKGRLNEYIVVDLLKQILPRKYSLGAGFIINTQGDMSPQCDIIVYDGLHNRPLFGDKAANIYPIECVYAFIEVKTTLTTKNLRESLEAILKIRRMAKKGKYYKSQELIWEKKDGKFVGQYAQVASEVHLPPRSFVVAFGSELTKDKDSLIERFREECNQEHKHFHGLLILDENVFASRVPNEFEPPKFRVADAHGLKAFLRTFLEVIREYPMGPMDIDRYLGDAAGMVERSS